jgi:hypothetical protein
MSSVVISGNTSGTITLDAPAVAGTTTLTLPATSGTVALTASPTFTGQATIPTINLTGGQITFPATAVPSADANTLDDYEEGTWTPVFIGGTTSGSCTYNPTFTNASYVKVGQLVYTTFSLVATSVHSGTGVLNLSGLPFAISSASGYGGSPSIGYWGSLAVSCTYISGYAGAGGTSIGIQYTPSAQGTIVNSSTAFIQNNAHIIGTFVYRASA